MADDFHIESIPYGHGEMTLCIPMKNYRGTRVPNYPSGKADETGEIQRALTHPIGTPTLKEIARKKKTKKTVVVVNDGSRPTVTDKLLPPLMKELADIGISDDDILILIATGTHRDVREDELEGLLGREIAGRYRVINHHCQDNENLVDIGKTSQGVPVVINRQFYEADLKILTGSIHPHQTAGFSGGRKSVLPGLASVETLKTHHGYHFRPKDPSMGWIDGNPLYQSQRSLSVAEMVVKRGGTVILPAACPDGIGSDLFYEWMAVASCPEEVLERFKDQNESCQGTRFDRPVTAFSDHRPKRSG